MIHLPIYVLTSNEYLHCLRPFARLWNRFWNDDQWVCVVGYENRPILNSYPHMPQSLPDNFGYFKIGKQADHTWSSGLIKFLEALPYEIFILFLDDYFVSAPVEISKIEALYAYMQAHPEVVKIDLSNDRLKVGHIPYHETIGKLRMIQSLPDALFQTSLQAAIWRRDFILRYLDPSESPWQFEKKGTTRVIADRRSGAFNGLILGSATPPVQYINSIGGEGSTPKTWALKRFPDWMVSDLKDLL